MELVMGKNGVELTHPDGNWDLKRGTGYSPAQAMVAAAGACGVYVFTGMLDASGVAHTFIRAAVDYENDETIRIKPVKKIMIDYYMDIDVDARDRAERILKLVHKNCPVIQSLNPNIEVVEQIHYE